VLAAGVLLQRWHQPPRAADAAVPIVAGHEAVPTPTSTR
jgi:hypothetical protein